MLNVTFIPGKPSNTLKLKEVDIFCTCRVSSVHNRRVTQFIVSELGRRSGFSQAAVESKQKLKSVLKIIIQSKCSIWGMVLRISIFDEVHN